MTFLLKAYVHTCATLKMEALKQIVLVRLGLGLNLLLSVGHFHHERCPARSSSLPCTRDWIDGRRQVDLGQCLGGLRGHEYELGRATGCTGAYSSVTIEHSNQNNDDDEKEANVSSMYEFIDTVGVNEPEEGTVKRAQGRCLQTLLQIPPRQQGRLQSHYFLHPRRTHDRRKQITYEIMVKNCTVAVRVKKCRQC